MGKARVHGSNAEIWVNDKKIGEVDKFSAKNIAELKKSQPLGQKSVTSQVVHKGWELSFEGGKVDWNVAALLHGQDELIRAGERSPYFTVKQTIKYFNGGIEEWIYPEVSIYGYELDVPTEEITEKFQGFTGENRQNISGDQQYDELDVVSLAQKVLAEEEKKNNP